MKLIVENLRVQDVAAINDVDRIQPIILNSLRSASQFKPEKLKVDKSFHVR